MIASIIPQVQSYRNACHRVEEVHNYQVEVDHVGGRVQETGVQEDDKVRQTQGNVNTGYCWKKVLEENISSGDQSGVTGLDH